MRSSPARRPCRSAYAPSITAPEGAHQETRAKSHQRGHQRRVAVRAGEECLTDGGGVVAEHHEVIHLEEVSARHPHDGAERRCLGGDPGQAAQTRRTQGGTSLGCYPPASAPHKLARPHAQPSGWATDVRANRAVEEGDRVFCDREALISGTVNKPARGLSSAALPTAARGLRTGSLLSIRARGLPAPGRPKGPQAEGPDPSVPAPRARSRWPGVG